MSQQQAPWLESAYGWNFGEGGWNTGMDQNLLKFSFMFDRNVDSIVASLPAAVNGQAHYLATDNRLYFAVGTTYFSTPVPKWFVIIERSTGQTHQYDGTSLVQVDNTTQLDSRLEAVELTINSLGSAAFEDVSTFATSAELDVVEAHAQNYTDSLRNDISNSGDPLLGASLVGYKNQTVAQKLGEAVSVLDFGATGDGITEDTVAIQACIDSVGRGGSIYLPSGVYVVTKLQIDATVRFYGDGGGETGAMTVLTGSWLKLKDNAGLLEGESLLTILDTYEDLPRTRRVFAKVEGIGLIGNYQNNTFGNGVSVLGRNVTLSNISVIQFPENGILCKDNPAGLNPGSNASVFENLWVGYNRKHGIEFQRPVQSGDMMIIGSHIFWNELDGVYCNQPNLVMLGTHLWWNLNGITINGDQSGQGVQMPGCRIYDNARAGVNLINNIKNISIVSCDIHGNGNEDRWAVYDPPLTSADISKNEQAGVFCNTAATNILLDGVNFGFMNNTGRQYYGLRSTNASAEFKIGAITVDGADNNVKGRAIVLSDYSKGTFHGTNLSPFLTHPGFTSNGPINLNGNRLESAAAISFSNWETVTPAAGVITFQRSTAAISAAAISDVTDIVYSGGVTGLVKVTFRNATAFPITFKQNVNKLRNNSGADVVLNQHQSITYIFVSGTAWQQV